MTKEQVKKSLAFAGITQAAAAAALNISPQNFNNKLRRMSFTDLELSTLAAACGAEYVSCFEFTQAGQTIRI